MSAEIKKLSKGVKEDIEKQVNRIKDADLRNELIKQKTRAQEFQLAYQGVLTNLKFWNLRLKETTNIEIDIKATLEDLSGKDLPFHQKIEI